MIEGRVVRAREVGRAFVYVYVWVYGEVEVGGGGGGYCVMVVEKIFIVSEAKKNCSYYKTRSPGP